MAGMMGDWHHFADDIDEHFSGVRDERDGGDQGTHYYEFKDGKFIHILSVMRH